jgi:hypothetical protein
MGLAQYFLTHEENMRQSFSQPSRRARRTLPDGTTIDYIMNDVVDFIMISPPQGIVSERTVEEQFVGESRYALILYDYYSNWYSSFVGYGLLSDDLEIIDETIKPYPYTAYESDVPRTGSFFHVRINGDDYVPAVTPLTHPGCTSIIQHLLYPFEEARDWLKCWLPKDVVALYYIKKYEFLDAPYGYLFYIAKQALQVGELNLTYDNWEGTYTYGDKSDEAPFMDLLEPTNYVADEGSEEIILADAWTEVGYAGDGGISGWFEYGFHKQWETTETTNNVTFAKGYDFASTSFVIFTLQSSSTEEGYQYEAFGLPPDYPLTMYTTYHYEWERTVSVYTTYLWDGSTLREIGYWVYTNSNEYNDVVPPEGFLSGTRVMSESLIGSGAFETIDVTMLDDNELAYYWTQAASAGEKVTTRTYSSIGEYEEEVEDERTVFSPEVIMGIKNLTKEKETVLTAKLLPRSGGYAYQNFPVDEGPGYVQDYDFIVEITDESQTVVYPPSDITIPQLVMSEPPASDPYPQPLSEYHTYRGLFFLPEGFKTLSGQNRCIAKLYKVP